jgi:hypothetical protein
MNDTNQIAKDNGTYPHETLSEMSFPCAEPTEWVSVRSLLWSDCRANMAAPWGVMGSGHFKSPKELEERGQSLRGGAGPSDEQVKVCKALQEVADEVGSGTHLAHSE